MPMIATCGPAGELKGCLHPETVRLPYARRATENHKDQPPGSTACPDNGARHEAIQRWSARQPRKVHSTVWRASLGCRLLDAAHLLRRKRVLSANEQH